MSILPGISLILAHVASKEFQKGERVQMPAAWNASDDARVQKTLNRQFQAQPKIIGRGPRRKVIFTVTTLLYQEAVA